MGRITEVIKHLIIINVIFFIAPQLLQAIDLQSLFALYLPENPNFGFWQYLTHIFMHGSVSHILFNMYGLWAFGTPLEQMWGKNKFIFFYLSAGLGAGLIYTAVNYYQFSNAYDYLMNSGMTVEEITQLLNINTNFYSDSDSFCQKANEILKFSNLTNQIDCINIIEANQLYNSSAVGASGAVYGVLVAFGLSFPNSKLALIFLPIPIAAKYFIPVMILGDLFFGVTKYSIGNIAHFAHIGGALIGFIIAWIWKNNQFKRWN